MTYTKWKRRPLDPGSVVEYIQWAGAPSISDLKDHFATDSESVRRVCGKLMYHGIIVPIPDNPAQRFIMKPTKKGPPSAKRILAASPKAKGIPAPRRDVLSVEKYDRKGASKQAREKKKAKKQVRVETPTPKRVVSRPPDDGLPERSTFDA